LERLRPALRRRPKTSKAPAPKGAWSLPNEIGDHTARPPSSAVPPRVSTRTRVYTECW